MYSTKLYASSEKKSNKPEIFHSKHKWCETPRELACLRITRLIACNVLEKAVYLMNKHKIDINCCLEDEGPNFYFFIKGAKTFIGVALIYSSFATIKKLIQYGADPFITFNKREPLEDLSKAFIPQITKLCKVKYNKTLMYKLGVTCAYEMFTEREKGIKNRYSLINKFILTEPESCNAYKFSKKEKIDMLHKNFSLSKYIRKPNAELFINLYFDGKLKYDNFFMNFFSQYIEKIKSLSDTSYNAVE